MPRKPNPPPDLNRLRELLDYDPVTGIFTWRVPRGSGGAIFRTKAGDVAGGNTTNGYRTIGIDGTPYLAHRLAWLMHHGEWPIEIDHRDRDRSNNAINNLKSVTRKQNCHNMSFRVGKSGFRGVARKFNKWRAYISVDGKARHLGYFDTAAEAGDAYLKAKAALHYMP